MKKLTIKQYAALKGITTQAVYNAIKNGSLKTVKIEKEILGISVSDKEYKQANKGL